MDQDRSTSAGAASGRCPQCGAALPAGALGSLCPVCLLRQGAASDSGVRPRVMPFEPPPVAEIARLFPQLEVMELVGRGGMGAVYKARQPALDRLVALKVLPARAGAGRDFAERFAREARALARLSHPNIVAVHEFGQVEGLHYFIMEYVDGTTLRQMERAGRLSPREALALIPALCDALQYAHDEGIVHRDIKPENVLVDRRGRVKVTDFGLARVLDLEPGLDRLTAEGQVMGTPHYMAPEQIEHPLEVDHRADIYALGVVFYEMLTGELPLGRFPAPSRKVQVDVRLDDVVLRALEKEPERRYQHASEVRTAVETIAQGPAPAVAGQGAADVRTWAPLQPSLVREVCAHMTDAEKREAGKRGLLFGCWNAATFFVPFFVVLGVPAPMGWILGLGGLLVGLSFYPLWRRMEREHLCGTAWARQQGITPDRVREAMAGRWCMALVEVRDGRRVANWRMVLVLAALLALAVGVAVWALSAYYLGLSAAQTKPSAGAWLAFVVVGTLLPLAFVWSRARPPERLPRLDRPEVSAPPAPEVTEELLRQVRRPAVGLFAVGVANWVVIPLVAAPLLYLSALSQGESGPRPALMLALLLSPFVLSGLVFVGSLRMMRLQSYGLAIAAAMLAMVVTPGNLIGFPIGIWALVVLLRPEVRAAFGTGRPLPALGRPAPSGGGHGGTTALIIFAVATAALILLAVTLVGLAILMPALARSRERREPVAIEESTAQPAAAFIHSVRVERDRATINGQGPGDYSLVLQIGATGTPTTWAAGLGQGPLTAFDGTLALTVPETPRLQFAVTRRGGGVTQYIDLASVPGLPRGRVVFRTVTPSAEADGSYVVADLVPESGPALPISVSLRPTREVAAGAAALPGFGPVTEKVISTGEADGQGLVFLDLETGETARPSFPLTLRPGHGPAFVELTPELLEWIRTQDMDVLLCLGDKGWDVMTLEMQQDVAGQATEWETVTPAAVAGIFARRDAVGQVRDLVPTASFGHAYRDGFGPVTAFRTRRDTLGIYQTEGIENETRKGVAIRYRLVQSAGEPAAAAEPTPAASFAKPGRTSKPGVFAPGMPASVLVVHREVNRKVADFAEGVDLSTPESACAAFHRVSARGDVRAWAELSWTPVDIAEAEARLHKETAKDPQAMAVYLKAVADARITEVLCWGEDLAETVTCLPLPPGMDARPYSARVFGRINGQWKSMGEERHLSDTFARAAFQEKKEALWQQYQDLAEKWAAPVPPEGQ